MSKYTTQHMAADVIQEAARQGKTAIYIESGADKDFRVIMPDADYGFLAEILYVAADRVAEQNMTPGNHIVLRD